jgi:hypothetical protein
MKLHHWLKLNPKMTQTKLANLAGCSIAMINRNVLYGRDLPPEVKRRVFFITHGSVRPDDFYDLNHCPDDLREHYLGEITKEANRDKSPRSKRSMEDQTLRR